MCRQRKNAAVSRKPATDDTCRDILKHHGAIDASIRKDPTTLIAAALAHCATLSASEEPLPATALSLSAHYFDPGFLWATPAARSAVVAWAQDVLIVQHVGSIQPFERLPDDCAGDVLEFFGVTRNESQLIAKHCSSPEAQDWVHAVIATAVAKVAVGAVRFSHMKLCIVSKTSYIVYAHFVLHFFLLSLRQRQRLIYCEQLNGVTLRPCRTAFQKRPTLRLIHMCVRCLPVMSCRIYPLTCTLLSFIEGEHFEGCQLN
jgi:hypothetical protein